jgi:hypothetical protein
MSAGDNWRVAATIESHAADPQHPDNEKRQPAQLWQTKEGHRFGKHLEPQRRVTFFALTGNDSEAVRAILSGSAVYVAQRGAGNSRVQAGTAPNRLEQAVISALHCWCRKAHGDFSR